MTTRQLYGFPLRSREGSLSVYSSGPVGREDIETLIEVLKIGLDGWPSVAEVRTYHRCVSCHWEGAVTKLVPREGEGCSGCPQCGSKVAPIAPWIIGERIDSGNPPTKEPEGETP
ncbi:MAG: hypothetical protein O7A04_02140 [Acidobacteria bacterium]|nr:hypothetical protein [Acidobacteriota bacterium]